MRASDGVRGRKVKRSVERATRKRARGEVTSTPLHGILLWEHHEGILRQELPREMGIKEQNERKGVFKTKKDCMSYYNFFHISVEKEKKN